MVKGNDDSDYGAALENEGRELTARLEKWRTSALSYGEFLKSRGRPIPDFIKELEAKAAGQQQPISPADPYKQVTRVIRPRIGEKRRTVLLFIAKATEAGKPITTKDIITEGGLDKNLVGNVVWFNSKPEQDYIARHGDMVFLTEKGFELLERAGYYRRSKKS